ncbi:Efem/EfeO family lipoprotein [Paenibacillus pasadenensis]|uniref:iron uptake system protein EfeO n=1 Tax=Paenibacillus pasadenensis TaxID=217090 RepID=UPI00204142A7|nr:iron uptake system protein EfeO [Paenibacillus pasadenensis]MCM3745742.1 Efem/EfeO family lipoprotein [Paenibacillus pasadenensis]
MSKRKQALQALSLGGVILLTACGSNAGSDANQENTAVESPAPEGATAAIQDSTAKMKEQTVQLQAALTKQDEAEVKKLGKEINDLWLSYENSVRQTFPLEYTEVEKYEMPIFSASAYDKVDFESLAVTARNLMKALDKLEQAKPSSASSSELLNKAVANYETFVKEQAAAFASATKTFADAVKSGDMEKAKLEYTKARVYFETIEPVAESFGDLDPRVDARLADVENEDEWTGYHRIEKALWADKSLKGQDVYADQLVKDTEELERKVQDIKLDAKTMVAGAIELINEAATSKITGEEEIFSKTDLVDLAANVNGSKTVYLAIIPALNEHNPDLAVSIDKKFQEMEAMLLDYQENGAYIAYDKLTEQQIRALSDKLSQLSELMTETAAIL